MLTATLVVPAAVVGTIAALLWLIGRASAAVHARTVRRRPAAPLAHELPYWQILDTGVVVGVDLTYSAALAVQGIDTDCLDGTELDRIGAQLHAAVRVLPAGTRLQWAMTTDRDHRDQLGAFRSGAPTARGLAALLADDKVAAVGSTAALRRSRLCLAISICGLGSRVARRVAGRRAFSTITAATHRSACTRVLSLRDQLGRALRAAGMRATALDGPALRQVVYELVNPDRAARVPAPTRTDPLPFSERQTAREQLCFAGARETPRALLIDGHLHRVITMSALPSSTCAAMVEQLTLQLPFSCRIQTTIELLDDQRALDRLKRTRNQASALAAGAARRNQEAEAQQADLEALIDQVLRGSLRLVRFALAVVLRVPASSADPNERLDQQSAEVLRVIAQLHGAQGQIEEYGQLDAFLATLPANAHHYARWLTCTSENAVDLLLGWQSWAGHDRPALLLENGRNYLVGLDPFDATLNNPNAFVAGTTGAGKSVFTNYLLMHLFAQGVRGLVIDVGGSYRRLIELFGGAYFSFDETADPALNLFYAPGDVRDSAGALDPLRERFMLTVIESLLVDAARPQLRHVERAVLGAAVRTLYANARTAPLLSDLDAVLRSGALFDDRDDRDIARQLSRSLRYWLRGPYGRLLNRPSTVQLTTDCAAFDLKGLPPDVQPTVVLILSGIIWNLLTRDRVAKKIVVFDEVWTLLSSPASARLLEELYRTSRKYRTSILSISQSVKDLTDSTVAEALVNNSASAYLLRHAKGHDEIGDTFHLNGRERALFEGLESRHGEYSEALVLSGSRHFLGRVVLTALEYWIATTHPADIGALRAMRAAHPQLDLLDLLQRCAQTMPLGAAQAPACAPVAAPQPRKESTHARHPL